MNQPVNHEFFMQRCLQIAKRGLGNVAPNPMVGCVIVHKGNIIGEGYHRNYGEMHAEVNAINSVEKKQLLKESTLYVTLEPCSHFGKTPPCADLIIQYKIPDVVIGMQDPFAKVNGMGIQRLKAAGCNVVSGVLEKECWELNPAFITYHTQKRPYIILKWAETLDGFIDTKREAGEIQQPNWITNEVCRSLVHKWRTEVQCIMVGTNTALIDNPRLNVRSWAGKNPIRLVLDQQLRLPEQLNLFNGIEPTLVINGAINIVKGQTEYVKMDFDESLIRKILTFLHDRGINTLFVEGGQELLNTFISQNLWDEARIFKGNKYFDRGVTAPVLRGSIVSIEKLRDNYLNIILNS